MYTDSTTKACRRTHSREKRSKKNNTCIHNVSHMVSQTEFPSLTVWLKRVSACVFVCVYVRVYLFVYDDVSGVSSNDKRTDGCN